MLKITILFEPPADVEAFNAYYLGTHMPLARRVPGTLKDEVTIFGPLLDGSPPPYHLMTELYFADEDAWRAGMSSPEGLALTADADNFPPGTGKTTMLIGLVV